MLNNYRNMKKILLYLFLFASLGELVSTLTSIPFLHDVCKPALMILLGMYYGLTQRSADQTLSGTVILAIIFSWVGDVLLMQAGQQFFMFGLAAFLMAHLFYILAYRQHRRADSSEALQGLQRIRFAFPIILAGTGLVTVLYAHLGDLRIPVLVYAGVITMMVIVALFRFGRTGSASFAMVFGGAILFMMSDSLIAINKFLEPLPYAHFWIMLTYISAQFLIIKGLLKHSD